MHRDCTFRLGATLAGLLLCLMAPPSTSAEDLSRDEVFPRDDVFGRLLADPKEPRFYGGIYRITFRTGDVTAGSASDEMDSGFIGAGHNFGIWTRRQGKDGIQVGLFGQIVSQFNLSYSSGDLINTDYLVGIPVSLRRGPWSGRVRLLHQSSHLGDEFLVRNHVIPVRNFGYEMFDGLLARDLGPARLYAGMGAVFNSSTDFDPMMFQAGAEYRSRWDPGWRVFGLRPTAVCGVDYRTWQQQDWDPTVNAVAGLELAREDSPTLVRFLGTLLHGHFPFAQFFDDTEVDAVGLMLQLEI